MRVSKRSIRRWGAAIAAIVWIVGGPGWGIGMARAAGREEVAPGLHVGDVLDEHNWQLARGLLPPEILRHYERGEYRNRIGRYARERDRWDAAFEAATKENARYLDVDENGTIIDKRTGRQPAVYYGIPFPHIDPKDPKAGVKVVWNQFLNYWNVGNVHNFATIAMVARTKLDRALVTDFYQLFYDGQSPALRPAKNPLHLEMQSLAFVVNPADLQGTATITWRYRDSRKRDSVWTYVPALRRVRAVSPSNRSDGFLGSDISQDDGHFFDGKPEDFTWRLIGLREGLRFVDPVSMERYLPFRRAKGGGWTILTEDDPPTAGYRTPGWTGVGWAPTDPILVKRRMWVVEGVPKDRYYLYGRLELWVDAQSWIGAWNRKFSWKGELLNTYQVMATRNHPAGPPDHREWLWNGTMVWQCAESFKHGRASLAGFRPHPGAPFARRVPLEPRMFEAQALARFGK